MSFKKFLPLIGITTGLTVIGSALTCVACGSQEEKFVDITCNDSRVILSRTKAREGKALEFKFKFNNDLCVMKSFDALLIGDKPLPASGYYSVDKLTDDPDGWLYTVSIAAEYASMITDKITVSMTLDYRPLKISLLIDDEYEVQPCNYSKIDMTECTYQSNPVIKIGSTNTDVLKLQDKPNEIRVGNNILSEGTHYQIGTLTGDYQYSITIIDSDVVINDIVIVWGATWKKVSIKIDESFEYKDHIKLSSSTLSFNESFAIDLSLDREYLYISDLTVKIGGVEVERDNFGFAELTSEGKMVYQLSIDNPDYVIDNIVITPVLSYQPYEVKVYDPIPFTPSGSEKSLNRIEVSRNRTEYGVNQLEIYAKPIETFEIQSLSVKIGDKPLSTTDYTFENVSEPGSEWTHKVTITNTALITDDVTICVDNCIRTKSYVTAITNNDKFSLQIETHEIATQYDAGSTWQTSCSFDYPPQCQIDDKNAKLYDNGKEVKTMYSISVSNNDLIKLTFPQAVTFTGDVQIIIPIIDKPYPVELKFVDSETKEPIDEEAITVLSKEISHGFYAGMDFKTELQLQSQDPNSIYFLADINSLKLWGLNSDEERREKELSNSPLTGDYAFSVSTELQTKGTLSIEGSSIGGWYDDTNEYIDPTGMTIEFQVYKKEVNWFNVIANDGVSSFNMGKYSQYESLECEINDLVIDKTKRIGDVQLWTVINGKKKLVESGFSYSPNTGVLSVDVNVVSDPNLETLIIDARMQTIDPNGFENEPWEMLNYWLGNAYQLKEGDDGKKYQTLDYVNYVYGVPDGDSLVGREKDVTFDGFKQKVRVVDTFRYQLEDQGSRSWFEYVSAPLLFEWSNVLHNGSKQPITKVVSTVVEREYGFWQYINPWYQGWKNDSGIRKFLRSNEFTGKIDSNVNKYAKKIKKDILCHCEGGSTIEGEWEGGREYGEFAFPDKYTIGTCSDFNCTQRPNADIYHKRFYDGTRNDAANRPFEYYRSEEFPTGASNKTIPQRIKYQYNSETNLYDIPIQYSTCIPLFDCIQPDTTHHGKKILNIFAINTKGSFNLDYKAKNAIAFAPCFCI